VAIALDHLDELFEIMLCQVFAGWQRGIRRPARCRMARNCSYFSGWREQHQNAVTSLMCGGFSRATVQ
jgi:hypothetical protein